REVSSEAIWTLSTAKPLSGVDQILDDNMDTYWQSDGAFPHYLTILFQRKITLSEISFYLNFTLDESYTPLQLSIWAGNTQEDLAEVHTADLREPVGWVNCVLQGVPDERGRATPLRARMLQVCIVVMHQNGRDLHIRQVKVYSPRHVPAQLDTSLPPCTSVEFTRFATIR
ncbi:anaphase-promoting complex subunit 10, partial [Tribonema minus]